jgi:GNAT superfamily N-acetyltransferase
MNADFHAIRRLRSDEWRLLKDLRLRALRSDPESFWDTEDEALAHDDSYWQSLAEKLATPDGPRFLILEVENEIAGVVFGSKKGDAEYGIGGLWVAPGSRGKGYGSLLVQEVVGWARSNPAAEILIWCHVGPEQAFYARNGFHELDQFRTHVSDGRRIVRMQWSETR